MANLVLDIWTSAARSPIRNCSESKIGSVTGHRRPARKIQPASTMHQAAKEKVSTGLLPSRSNREPRNHRLLSPPRNETDVTRRIVLSDMPHSERRKATVNAVMPP